MKKLEAYKHLSRIKDNAGVNIVKQVKIVSSCKGDVPLSVIRFIDNYEAQSSLETFKYIYESRHKNKLYKNLVDESASVNDKLIALSSYQLQCSIKLKTLTESDKPSYIQDTYLSECSSAINNYYRTGDNNCVTDMHNKLRSRFKELFNK